MSTVTINLSEETKERLKLEKNQSALVEKLLKEHYETKNPNDLRAKLDALDEKKKHQIELIEKDKEKYMQRLTLHAETESAEKEIESAIEKKNRELKASIEKNFMQFAGRDPTDAELDEAFRQFRENKEFNLLDYIDECNV
jgi:thioesterase domain-containing protein|tara:strand:+ start:306 stop:728 length:423 start_codon:yes stop_codon:yes gene_type:complete